jgi:predicted nuclease of predicted toxin-antitoxin system
MKILVDMNLSPAWLATFEENGIEALHWSEIGSPKAKDREILNWARENGFFVFTHDLDFGHLLALTHNGLWRVDLMEQGCEAIERSRFGASPQPGQNVVKTP